METKSIIEALKFLISFFTDRLKDRSELKKKVSAELRAVITETELYLYSLHKGEKADPEKEADLARQWSSLSGFAGAYNKDASTSFLEISRFWTNPSSDLAKESLDIIKELRALLDKGRLAGTFFEENDQ